VSFVQNMPEKGPIEVSMKDKLEFYGLYKQVTVGPCNTKQPSTLDIQARYKWQAWKRLGNLNSENAKKQYISKLLTIAKKMPESKERSDLIRDLEGKQEEAEIDFYCDMISQPSRAVYWFLLLNKIPHKIKIVKLMEMEHKKESFLKINPLGTVPAISDNGFSFNESATIIRYLSATRDIEDHWYPENLRQRVTVDRYLDWHPSNTRQGCAGTFRENYLNPKLGVERNEIRARLFRNILENALRLINEFWLRDDKYVGNLDKPSYADLQMYCELKNLEIIDFDFSKWPRVLNFMKKMERLPHHDEVHKVFNKIASSASKPKL